MLLVSLAVRSFFPDLFSSPSNRHGHTQTVLPTGVGCRGVGGALRREGCRDTSLRPPYWMWRIRPQSKPTHFSSLNFIRPKPTKPRDAENQGVKMLRPLSHLLHARAHTHIDPHTLFFWVKKISTKKLPVVFLYLMTFFPHIDHHSNIIYKKCLSASISLYQETYNHQIEKDLGSFRCILRNILFRKQRDNKNIKYVTFHPGLLLIPYKQQTSMYFCVCLFSYVHPSIHDLIFLSSGGSRGMPQPFPVVFRP